VRRIVTIEQFQSPVILTPNFFVGSCVKFGLPRSANTAGSDMHPRLHSWVLTMYKLAMWPAMLHA
jgi:hypothetical protein